MAARSCRALSISARASCARWFAASLSLSRWASLSSSEDSAAVTEIATATPQAMRRRRSQRPSAVETIGSRILAQSLRAKTSAAMTEVCSPKAMFRLSEIAPAASASRANRAPRHQCPKWGEP